MIGKGRVRLACYETAVRGSEIWWSCHFACVIWIVLYLNDFQIFSKHGSNIMLFSSCQSVYEHRS